MTGRREIDCAPRVLGSDVNKMGNPPSLSLHLDSLTLSIKAVVGPSCTRRQVSPS